MPDEACQMKACQMKACQMNVRQRQSPSEGTARLSENNVNLCKQDGIERYV